jgi:lipid A 4'-phosphatase
MPFFFLFFAAALTSPVIWPRIDVVVSNLFYKAGQGFFLADEPIFVSLHWLAYYGARALGASLTLLVLAAFVKRKPVIGVNAKGWLFLLLALLIGPVLIANVGFKDHWGRARPREVIEFGGTASFSPALVPQPEIRRNGSFVSGDGAFGFFLPTLAYVVPQRRTRRTFWGCMVAGALFSLARLVMGAHFFSDIVYAAFFMLLASAVVHTTMYGRIETAAHWRRWFKPSATTVGD